MHLATTSCPRARFRLPLERLAALGLALSAGLTLAAVPARAGVIDGGAPAIYDCPLSATAGTDTVGVDGTHSLSIGRGLAQSFFAADTLVRSIEVWLPAYPQRASFRLHLWLTRAGSDGRPKLDAVIADGGGLAEGHGSGVRPARYQFDFVPPIALPERGRYALAVLADDCGVLDVPTTRDRLTGVGDLWETTLRGCENRPGTLRSRLSGESLMFQVEFCDTGLLAHGRTWGEIKTVYR